MGGAGTEGFSLLLVNPLVGQQSRLSRLFFQLFLFFTCLILFRLGLLLQMLLSGIKSKWVSSILALGFGGGFGGCWGLEPLLALNLLSSSDVNWTVDDLPPRNFSQPGASAIRIKSN